MNQIADVLQNYTQNDGNPASEAAVAGHFEQVAQTAPSGALASGLAAMFHSDKTPPFAQMVGQLFASSNGPQRANILNTLLASGPAAGLFSQLAQSAGIALPGNVGGGNAITPETATQITPEMVQQTAAHAAQHDPSIVERISDVCAQHPVLVRTLGAAAMSIALSHLAHTHLPSR